jgi:hypothetical protein
VPLSRSRLIFMAVVVARALLAERAHADPPTKQQCVLANENAQDLERAGRLIEAREQLETCAASACPGVVRTDCAERLEAVGSALPTVVLTPKNAGGGDAGAASLAIDGVAQPVVLDGRPVAVDPGLHTFTVTVEGLPPVSLRISVGRGEHVRRDVVLRAPAEALATVEPPAPGSAPANPRVSPAPPPGNVVMMRRIGWAALGVGAAGLTLGAIFGFLAIGKKEALGDECNGRACPRSAQPDIDGLHFDGVASDISFAVAVLGVGAGSVLLFIFPDSEAAPEAPREAAAGIVVRPWAGLGHLGVKGTFR